MSITPQQAFEAIATIRNDVEFIRPSHGDEIRVHFRGKGDAGVNFYRCDRTIDWGDLKQYPPPEPRWRKARKGDEGKECRVKDCEAHGWKHKFTFVWFLQDSGEFLAIDNQIKGRQSAYSWKFCEVQE